MLFGMYWRISPLVFSFAPCSQEWYGRAKLGIKPFHDLLLTGEFISVLSRYPTYLVLVGYQSFSCRASQRSGSFSYKPADQHKMRTSVVCCHDTPPCGSCQSSNHRVYQKVRMLLFISFWLYLYNRNLRHCALQKDLG